MELALSEQLKERQEMEKKLQKLVKTMDYLERAKREESSPLIEAAYRRRLEEEEALHEREQQVCIIVSYSPQMFFLLRQTSTIPFFHVLILT